MRFRQSTKPIHANRQKKQAAPRRRRAQLNVRRLGILRQEKLEDRNLLSVDLLGSFAGMTIDSNTGGTLFTPPDSCGAASSGTTYVETVNQQVTVYNKTTGAATATDNFNHFLVATGGLPRADAASALFDPSITYDDQIGRFIVSDMDYDFGAGHVSRFDFAVSKSSDPATLTAADWNFYQIDTSENDGTALGTFDADFPGNLGWNHDALVVTFNMFAADGSSAHVQVDSVSSADLAGDVSQDNLHIYRNDNFDALSLRPAVMHDSKAGDPMWLVDQAGSSTIEVFKMTNVLSSSASFNGTQLPVDPYTDIHASGVYPKQPDGTTVTMNQDSRIQKVAEAGNLLVASQAINVSPTENDARWYEIDVSTGTPVVKQQGNVSGGDNTYAYYPAIDINLSGDIGMTYLRSGTDTPTDFMSMWLTGRAPSDVAGTMETPVLVKAGAANYSDSNANGPQAGDFSGISADADGSFFAASEYATSRASNNWGTEIAHFSISATSPPPSAVYVSSAWNGFSKGQVINDADPVTPGNQGAVFGTTAFATIDAALSAVAPGGTVFVNSGDYSTESVSLADNDTLDLLGDAPGSPGTVTLGSLAGAAGTTVDTGSVGNLGNALREGGLAASTTYAGLVSGPGSLVIAGGSLTLSDSNNSYAGGTNVVGGALLVDGAAGSGAVVVGSGATLGGTGAIAGPLTVNAGGTVSPGDPATGAGTLATGPLTLSGTYAAQIGGATSPGKNYDQLDVTGASTLSGGGVTLTLGYAPAAGDSIVLISGTGAIAGPVSVNGAVVNEGGQVVLSFGGLSYDFQVSYAGDRFTLTLDPSPTINVDSYSTSLNNIIDLSASGGDTIVAVNGSTIFDAPTAALTSLTFVAASDNDTFNVHSIAVPTTINGGTGADTFNVTGPLAAALTIAGGQHAAGNALVVTAVAGMADALTIRPTAADAGNVFDASIAGGAALGSVAYSGIHDIQLVGQAADGDTANVLAAAGKDTTIDLGAQTVSITGFAPVSVTGFVTVNLDAAGAGVNLLDKATDDHLTVTATGPTSGAAAAASSGQIVHFTAASHIDVDLSGGGKVIVNSSDPVSTLAADEPIRTIFVTASDGTKLVPVVLNPDVATVELDGGANKTTFVVTPGAGLLPPGKTDSVGQPNFQAPGNLVVEVVGGGAASDSALVVANYDPATDKLSPLASGMFAIDDRTSATSGTLHLFHNNGSAASGPVQYPDIGYTNVGKVDVETSGLVGRLTTQQAIDWIVQLYAQILGREASANEVSFWLNLIESGVSAQGVAAGFVGSAEYRANQINLLYEKYLGRKADSDGLAYWSSAWGAYGGPEPVEAGMIGSAEFYATAARLHPNLSPDAAWITVLYQDLLGRDPEPQGLRAWVGLQSLSRQSVVLSFVTSDEFRLDLINNLFQTYLGRPVDSPTASAMLHAMQQGMTQDQLLTLIVSSDEYINRAT
ncbi:MAG TPA: DUF4214 domain-containing protein [Pirellulales bacterium]